MRTLSGSSAAPAYLTKSLMLATFLALPLASAGCAVEAAEEDATSAEQDVTGSRQAIKLETCGDFYDPHHSFRVGETITIDAPSNFVPTHVLSWEGTPEALTPKTRRRGDRTIYAWKVEPFMITNGQMEFTQIDAETGRWSRAPTMECYFDGVQDPAWLVADVDTWANTRVGFVERSVDLGTLPSRGLVLRGPNFGNHQYVSRFFAGGSDKTARVALGQSELRRRGRPTGPRRRVLGGGGGAPEGAASAAHRARSARRCRGGWR